MISLKPGTIFTNRTRKYLAPGMRYYGQEFSTKLSSLATMGVFIDKSNNIIFIFDIRGAQKYDKYLDPIGSKIHFMHVLSWFKEQDYYVNDYPYDSGRYGHQHAIVFKFPFDTNPFLQGNYSKIYQRSDIDKFFKKELDKNKPNPNYQVLTKDLNYKIEYLNNLNAEFRTRLKLTDIENHSEYDRRPIVSEEFLT
jgi:hypothetical protein